MDWILTRALSFFMENTPSQRAILLGGLPCLLWSYAGLWFAGRLKRTCGLKTGYTRKIFHVLTFAGAALIQAIWGTAGVCLFGAMASITILHALYQGRGGLLFEALAREQDAPHEAYFIFAPYLATLIGGLASNILFGEAALAGYLVTGLGDAAGEPVGTRFGNHPFRAPSPRGVSTIRTVEGSLAVCLAATAALALSAILSPALTLTPRSIYLIPLMGAGCALVEAISPHGWDNALLQILPSGWALALMG